MALPNISNFDSLLADGKFAFENVALAIETALGSPLPEVEISFRDLHITARLPLAKPGSKGPQVPTIWTHIQQKLMKCFSNPETTEKEILHGITGVFKPSRITLLLARLPRIVAYTNQKDEHEPHLSVQETFEFAHACCGGADLDPWVAKALKNTSEEQSDHALKIIRAQHKHAADLRVHLLGLSRCKDTMVGNAMSGVSGGERKRVTTGEMTFGRKRAMLLDKISTGLDAATTYDIVNSLKSLTRYFKANIVVSLQQPPPEVFNLFDDVLIMNSGRIMYHGPRDQVQEYFQNMGF
ncbi:unnamed protein product [Phytophthora lilii]|uniref:Unnamed protein product n=1 Tax=Phytophthora lilii TaxID=2077276 RepID=A0A9W6U5D7_9STRA|nr:unnamed protein product [Phytophthora lilii]